MKAAIYIRVSRRDEAAILENQRQAARAYADRMGFEVVGVFEDQASGKSADRPGLTALLEAAGRGEFELAIFTSLSRMTRGGIEAALYILDRLVRVNVGWHFVEQPILNFDDKTPPLARDILFAVMAAVDKDYRRVISEKTKAALARRRALGLPLGRHKNGCSCKLHRRRAEKRAPPATTGEIPA
ncbi:MAG TPA: recombinase family protein [Candidatus Thermoplasmatota archaeon]|nr:recombinase family protein [Candidatus Thermoplasmatota archaeon]